MSSVVSGTNIAQAMRRIREYARLAARRVKKVGDADVPQVVLGRSPLRGLRERLFWVIGLGGLSYFGDADGVPHQRTDQVQGHAKAESRVHRCRNEEDPP